MPRLYEWTEGITDSQSLHRAIDFAQRWHRGEWSIATLPRDLGAGFETGPAAPVALGASITRQDGRRGIALNEGLVGTASFVPVLAHECGHLFQPSVTVGLCRSSVQMSRREREAWWIAAILAVPLDAVRTVRLWGDDPSVVASQLDLPRALVAMRKALALLFGELPPERLAEPEVMLKIGAAAMQGWVRDVSQQLANRAAP